MPDIIDPRYKENQYQKRLLQRRLWAEQRFRGLGILGLLLASSMLALLLGSILYNGAQGFITEKLHINVFFDAQKIDPGGMREEKTLRNYNYDRLVYARIYEIANLTSRKDKRRARQLLQVSASNQLRQMVLDTPDILGSTQQVVLNVANTENNPAAEALRTKGYLKKQFNWNFFIGTESSDAGEYGILGALAGSFWTILICFLISFPMGVITAVYLEEFAPQNRITDFIEININNLAAVPSIVFGLMGAIVFVTWLRIPQSTALVGGMVLSLLTLPTIIVAARAALKSVSKSYKQAAIGLGASEQQAVLHFVLPSAVPGIMTGTIIGLAGALGETAPLMLIGLVGFLDGIPATPLDTAPTLATSIFNLFGKPTAEFSQYLSNSTIIVLLFLLVLLNGSAAWIRAKTEKKNS